ncbi:AbrB/MazE/SpoVT family DNA-binding domain-containing protein [Desulfobacterium sp. N47]|uniref:SpoVT-AbrB domain-containing protein n=1 Tax=uncultured Desulfobacterium sp. TaxID=201089 RepID=E1YLU1_9BACT|nr:hypothetical protein N47_E45860 [uncultured Desulfobacterium sp.]
MQSTVTSKGQVTIPKEIRNILNIRPNDKVDFTQEGDRVVLVPLKTLKDLRGSVGGSKKGSPDAERRMAKSQVGKRVVEEME